MSGRSNIFRVGFFVAIFLAASAIVVSGQGEHKILVASVVGDWSYAGKPVKFAQSLTPIPGECLSGSDGSVVLQVDDKNQSLHPLACEKSIQDPACHGRGAGRCAVPLDPREWKPTGAGLGKNMLDAFKVFLSGDTEKYMVAASRGLEAGLVDAVVPLQDHSVDLASAFGGMGAGEYWIKLSPVNGSSASGDALAVHFTPRSAALVRSSSLQPGLYRLLLVDKSGAPEGSDSWILIASAENYPSASGAFHQAVETSAKWPEDMDPSAVRALLRAYLESLSVSGAKSKP